MGKQYSKTIISADFRSRRPSHLMLSVSISSLCTTVVSLELFSSLSTLDQALESLSTHDVFYVIRIYS